MTLRVLSMRGYGGGIAFLARKSTGSVRKGGVGSCTVGADAALGKGGAESLRGGASRTLEAFVEHGADPMSASLPFAALKDEGVDLL